MKSDLAIGQGAILETAIARIESEAATCRWQLKALVDHFKKNPDAVVQLKVKHDGMVFTAYEKARILGLLKFTNLRRRTESSPGQSRGVWVTATATELMLFWARSHAIEQALVE